MTNTATMPKFNSFIDVATLDKNRPRTVVFYGRVSTEHEAQLSALENQMQWYNDEADRHQNWTVVDTYIDVYNQRLIPFDTKIAVQMPKITAFEGKSAYRKPLFLFYALARFGCWVH